MGGEPVLQTECSGKAEQVYVVLFFLRKVGSIIHHPSLPPFQRLTPQNNNSSQEDLQKTLPL